MTSFENCRPQEPGRDTMSSISPCISACVCITTTLTSSRDDDQTLVPVLRNCTAYSAELGSADSVSDNHERG